MPFTVKFRELLEHGAELEFTQLTKRLREFLLTEHNEDGTHRPNASTFPVGSWIGFGGATIPSGWLLCDGAAVSRATYKNLLDVLGTAYGVGDGSTSFNIPDFRGRFVLGQAVSGTGSTLGAVGGSIDHTHTGGSLSGSTGATAPGTDSQGSHTHTVSSHSHSISSDGSHNHSFSDTSSNASSTNYGTVAGPGDGAGGTHTHDVSGNTSGDGSHSHGGSTGNQNPGTDNQGGHTHTVSSHTHGAGSLAISSMGASNPPFQVGAYIIYTGVVV